MKTLSKVLSKSAGSIALKVAIVIVAVIGGTGMVSSSVFASLAATATNTSGGSVTTGTLKFELASSSVAGITGGFSTPITKMAPGDTVNRYIDLTNSGTLDGINPKVALASSAVTPLTTNATTGLQITIQNCSIAWTASGTCSETTTSVLVATPATTLVAGATSITLPSTLTLAKSYLKISMGLPAGTENIVNGVIPTTSVLGQTTNLTWSFSIDHNAAGVTNS